VTPAPNPECSNINTIGPWHAMCVSNRTGHRFGRGLRYGLLLGLGFWAITILILFVL
jgi:hypothetical protein